MKNNSLILIFLGQLLIANMANAGGLLGNSLSKLGIMSSINRPGVVNDQLGG